jgi:Tol biopolymer transport system component
LALNVGALAAQAAAQSVTCSAVPITPPLSFQNQSNSHDPAISGDGRYVAFVSDANATWDSPSPNSIWLYNTDSGELRMLAGQQLTFAVAISHTGSRVAFAAAGNLYLVDTATNQVQQVTSFAPGTVIHDDVSLSDDGQQVAFSTTANTAGGNPDGSLEVYVWRSGSVHQITQYPSGYNVTTPRLSGDGKYVAYQLQSSSGSSAHLQNLETGAISQIVADSSYDRVTALTTDASRIAFATIGWNPVGQNSDLGPELFMLNRTSSELVQVTHTSNISVAQPQLDAIGRRLLFASNGDLTGHVGSQGPTLPYVIDFVTGELTAVTQYPLLVGATEFTELTFAGFGRDLSISKAGTAVVFAMNANMGIGWSWFPSSIFLASCPSVGPSTTTTTGTDVTVTPSATLPDGSITSVSLNFDSVTTSGVTTVSTTANGPPPPSGFKLTSPPVYYDVETTATFSGNIEICFTWAQGQIANERNARLFHFENGSWVNLNATVDVGQNRICGQVSSLSPFVIAEPNYVFTGFLQPVDNAPTVNAVKAGSAIPVKFRLGGDFGLDVFEPGYPVVQALACDSLSPIDTIEETVNAGSSRLHYVGGSNQYVYTWKTDRAWAGSCRQLSIRFADGSTKSAMFRFAK